MTKTYGGEPAADLIIVDGGIYGMMLALEAGKARFACSCTGACRHLCSDDSQLVSDCVLRVSLLAVARLVAEGLTSRVNNPQS